MIADKIIMLRKSRNITQAELARAFGITRSSINAWEIGISVPSTQYVMELAKYFKVSTDYLLGLSSNKVIDVSNLSEEDIQIIYSIVSFLEKKNSKQLSCEINL
ncbi:MAG: helix-turn-helix transcriptional regulator [Erysipelotrichaceae bacterium]